MVGIGGVPNAKADGRLGDVVASQPHGTFAGVVVQFNVGKATPSGFERTGGLNSPPQILLVAVARVHMDELRSRSKLSEHISKLSEHISKLEGIARLQRSKAGPDVLFEAACGDPDKISPPSSFRSSKISGSAEDVPYPSDRSLFTRPSFPRMFNSHPA